jgi:hypothetical protein
MSERMIELHRARLLAAGKGSKTGTTGASSGINTQLQNGSQQPSLATIQSVPQTPQQYAVATMKNEDLQLKRFLQRLQHERDDSQPGEALIGPTVPTALSRRMLHRQGAGYYDGTVAAVTSAAADRFLATILQQAVACRDQRLKGAELARQSARKRKRHRRQYQESVDDRRRRKEEKAAYRDQVNVAAIAAADALQQKSKPGTTSDANKTDEGGATTSTTSPPKTTKKKKAADTPALNGYKKRPSDLSDDEASYDSIDEEEEYYGQYYNDDDDNDDSDSSEEGERDEDEDETMILRDIKRPLEGWDYSMNGKLEIEGVTTHLDDDGTNSDDATSDHDGGNVDDDVGDDNDDDVEAMSSDLVMENGVSNDASAPRLAAVSTTALSRKSSSKSPDEKKNSVVRMSIDSPQPPSNNGQGETTT